MVIWNCHLPPYTFAKGYSSNGQTIMLEDAHDQSLEAFKNGERESVSKIWEQFQARAHLLARQKLGQGHNRVADEEDVAQSAFISLVRLSGQGKLESIENEEDLWNLLATITMRKVYARVKYNRTAKRGGGTVRGESVFLNRQGEEAFGLAQIRDDELSPAEEVMAREQCLSLLAQLDEAEREIALLKLEGFSNEEIAARLQCSTRRITRKLTLIRERWSLAGDE